MADKSFYDKVTYKQSREASTLDSEFTQAIKGLFRKYIDLGYSPREISHLMQDQVRCMELVDVLSNQHDRAEIAKNENDND